MPVVPSRTAPNLDELFFHSTIVSFQLSASSCQYLCAVNRPRTNRAKRTAEIIKESTQIPCLNSPISGIARAPTFALLTHRHITIAPERISEDLTRSRASLPHAAHSCGKPRVLESPTCLFHHHHPWHRQTERHLRVAASDSCMIYGVHRKPQSRESMSGA